MFATTLMGGNPQFIVALTIFNIFTIFIAQHTVNKYFVMQSHSPVAQSADYDFVVTNDLKINKL